MRYPLAVLCLALVLPAVSEVSNMPAAPIPAKAKSPEVYALVYVGWGKNDARNARRIADAIKNIQTSTDGAVRDPKVNRLPLVQEQERKGWRERDAWARSKIRVEALDGTTVLRIWFTVGTPEEQALIVNAAVRHYLKQVDSWRSFRKESLDRHRAEPQRKKFAERGQLAEWEKSIQRLEEEINNLPRLLEWAAVKVQP